MVPHFSDILILSDISTPLNTDDVILAFSSSLFYFLSGTHVSSSPAVTDSLRSLHAFQDLTYPWPLVLFSPLHKGQPILAAWPRAPDPWSDLNFATSQWGLFIEHVVRVQWVNVVEVLSKHRVCDLWPRASAPLLWVLFPSSCCSLCTVSLLLPILEFTFFCSLLDQEVDMYLYTHTNVHVHTSRLSSLYYILLGLEPILAILKRLQ